MSVCQSRFARLNASVRSPSRNISPSGSRFALIDDLVTGDPHGVRAGDLEDLAALDRAEPFAEPDVLLVAERGPVTNDADRVFVHRTNERSEISFRDSRPQIDP